MAPFYVGKDMMHDLSHIRMLLKTARSHSEGQMFPITKSTASSSLLSNPGGYSCPTPGSTSNLPLRPLSVINAYSCLILGKNGSWSPMIMVPVRPLQSLALTKLAKGSLSSLLSAARRSLRSDPVRRSHGHKPATGNEPLQ